MYSKIREKRQSCGYYTNVSIFENVEQEVSRNKRRKKNVTKPAQQKLNDKRARNYFSLLVRGNFKPNDFFVTLTYNDEHVPSTVEEAENEVKKYIRRLKRYANDKTIKHIFVTEMTDENGEVIRIHHHLLISANMSYEDIVGKWAKGRGKNKKQIGIVKAQRIKNEKGIERICAYLIKAPVGKRRWSASKNLERPIEQKNDSKYSRRKLNKLATSQTIKTDLTLLYPKYDIIKVITHYNELLGYSIFIEMKLKKEYRKVKIEDER